MKIPEKILIVCLLAGIALKATLVSQGDILNYISLSIFAGLYYPFGFFIFNTKKLTLNLKELIEQFKTLSIPRVIGTIGFGISLSLICIGIMFKLDQLPGWPLMLNIGTFFCGVGLIVLTVKLFRSEDKKFYTAMLTRV